MTVHGKRPLSIMSLSNDDKGGNNGGCGLSDLQAGSDPNGLVAGLMGLQQQHNGNIGLQSQDGNDANVNSALMGGMSAGMMGGQIGVDGQQDANSFLAQQQALMAMAAGTGLENGSNKDALMNLLAKQGKSQNQCDSFNCGCFCRCQALSAIVLFTHFETFYPLF
jgi:hypothetical protein